MKKILSLIFLSALVSSCSFFKEPAPEYLEKTNIRDVSSCPIVKIRKEDAVIIQKSDVLDLFEIEAIGYNGYCLYNEETYQYKAIVSPVFQITRLKPSNVSDIHFSYYIETANGPTAYLGRKTYFAKAVLPVGAPEVVYTADGGTLTIADPATEGVDLYIGLNAITQDSEYRK